MKRFLSLLLASLLICGAALSGIAFAAESDMTLVSANDPVSYNYAFNSAAHNIQSDQRSLNSGYHTVAATVASASDPWGYVNIKSASGYSTNGDNCIWHYNSGFKTTGLADGEVKAAIGFEIVVGKDGVYTPSFSFKASGESPIVDVILVPKPADTSKWDYTLGATVDDFFGEISKVSSACRIGTVDMYSATAAAKTETFLPISLKAGSYYLVLLGTGCNDNWVPTDSKYSRLYMNSFALTGNYVGGGHELTYKFTSEVFNPLPSYLKTEISEFDNKWQNVPGWRDKTGLFNTTFMKWDATTTINASKETVEPFKTMTFASSAPWEYLLSISHNQDYLQIDPAPDGYFVSCTLGGYGATSPSADVVAFRIRVPYAGKYKVTVNGVKIAKGGAAPFIYFVPYDENESYTAGKIATAAANSTALGYFNCLTEDGAKELDGIAEAKKAGDYILIFKPQALSRTLSAVNTDGTDFSDQIDPATGDVTGSVSGNQHFKISSVTLTPYTEPANPAVAARDAIINVDPENAEKSGTATDAKLTLTAKANGTALAATLTGADTYAVGDEVTVTAGDVSGYKFECWKDGDTAVSEDAEYTFTISSDLTLCAVYEQTADATVVFYNGNGVEISREVKSAGAKINAPALPSITGYTATAWATPDGDLYGAGDEIEVKAGRNIFVAQFDAPETVTVTIDGEDETYDYGALVSLSAPEREGGAGHNLFNYWEKDGEIVSFGNSYSFYAWADCEVNSVYTEYKPAAKEISKILLSTKTSGGDIAAMAEFIGITGAKERGIIFGTSSSVTLSDCVAKGVAKTDKTQFTVLFDSGYTARGYAILANGDVIYSK